MEPVGKIIIIDNRFPGPAKVALNTVGEALRKNITLCFFCTRFAPGEPERHCPIAQALFLFCTSRHIGTALVRCGEFQPRNVRGLRVTDVADGRTGLGED